LIADWYYMPTMLRMNSYDTICHEHLEYYSLAVTEYILKKADMKIFNATLNDINGGSIRCFATHANNFVYKNEDFIQNIKSLHQEEFDLELDTDKPYNHFQERINIHREELNALLRKLKKEGKHIHVYGASTKGNTILQWCGIDNRIIDVAAERNPDKYGCSYAGDRYSHCQRGGIPGHESRLLSCFTLALQRRISETGAGNVEKRRRSYFPASCN